MKSLLDFNGYHIGDQTHSPIPRLHNDNFLSLFADTTTYEESISLSLPIHSSSSNTLPLSTATSACKPDLNAPNGQPDLKEPNPHQQSDRYDSNGLDIRDLFDGQLDL